MPKTDEELILGAANYHLQPVEGATPAP
jgi:hypothetical protein